MLRSSLSFVFFTYVCLSTASTSASADTAFVARHNYGELHEPTNQVLHGAGQSDEIEFANYVHTVGASRHPAMFNFYRSAKASADSHIESIANWATMLAKYPDDLRVQVGLSMVGVEDDINAGTHDDGITALADALDALDRPVYVRIGYEANGSWNGYTASKYIPAFRRIADILHDRSDRIAVLWCAIPISASRIPNFYPGEHATDPNVIGGSSAYNNPKADDRYIDWWAIDLFEPKYLNPSNSNYAKTTAFLDKAHAAEKPVMIGESTPQTVGADRDADSWDDWYAYYFDLIRTYPGIKAFIYINRNWAMYVSQGWADWGDARIETSEYVAEQMRSELSAPEYLHANSKGAAGTFVVAASADAYVRNGEYADEAHGVSDPDELKIKQSAVDGYSRNSYLKFELNDYIEITAATLRFLGKSDSDEDLNLQVHGVTTEQWQETTLTWNNQPALESPAIGTAQINDNGKEKWSGLTVTDYVKTKFEAGNSSVSFALTDFEVIDRQATLRSADEGNAPPQLIIHGIKKAPQSISNIQMQMNLENALGNANNAVDLTFPTSNGNRYQVWETTDLRVWSKADAVHHAETSQHTATLPMLQDKNFYIVEQL